MEKTNESMQGTVNSIEQYKSDQSGWDTNSDEWIMNIETGDEDLDSANAMAYFQCYVAISQIDTQKTLSWKQVD